MKSPSTKPQRHYQQKARALATEATGQRILEAFLKRLGEQWFEDVTLETIARDAGVTVQTIMRRFGSKAGLLEAARENMGKAVLFRRDVEPGDIDRAIDALTRDYETVGDLILRLLAQEDRHPVLKPVLDHGRRGHREWLAEVFAGSLKSLPSGKRTAALDALVVATDLYIWKLVRRDLDRPVSAFKALVKTLLQAALPAADSHP